MHVHIAAESGPCPARDCDWTPIAAESTSARLARVEQERDLARQLNAELARLAAGIEQERDELREARDVLRARLHDVVGEPQWCVARDGGRNCTACGHEIRRGEAYAVNTISAQLSHVFCPEVTS